MEKIRTYETPEGTWNVEFGNEIQTFTLDYYPDTEDEAEWMARQLQAFFKSVTWNPDYTSESSLHKHSVNGMLPSKELIEKAASDRANEVNYPQNSPKIKHRITFRKGCEFVINHIRNYR